MYNTISVFKNKLVPALLSLPYSFANSSRTIYRMLKEINADEIDHAEYIGKEPTMVTMERRREVLPGCLVVMYYFRSNNFLLGSITCLLFVNDNLSTYERFQVRIYGDPEMVETTEIDTAVAELRRVI